MPIAKLGGTVKIVPGDSVQMVQMVHSDGHHDFLEDRAVFRVRVTAHLHDGPALVGLVGVVVEGPAELNGLIATLLTRLDLSAWESDEHSAANFMIGNRVAERVAEYPHWHPYGWRIAQAPYYLRFGSIDSEA